VQSRISLRSSSLTSEFSALSPLGLFCGFPQGVLFFGRGGLDGAAVGFQALFHVAESPAETIGGFAQGVLGIEIELARQVRDGEQQVAQLVGHGLAVSACAGVVEFSQLFLHLVAHARSVGPVEAHRAGLLARAHGAYQGRGAARNAVEGALLALLGLFRGLELGPAGEGLFGIVRLHVAEHVRVPADELAHDSVDDLVDAEGAFPVA